MKILFTGMGSSHCKKTDNASFFSSLADGYSELAEVVWSAPKITWSRADLESFDLVFLGFMPITSKSANHLYGALHVLNLLYESPKLRLVVDNPQIWQYKNSISSFRRAPEQIFTDFYKTRYDFTNAKVGKVRHSIDSVAEKMTTLAWPITIAPRLPWSSDSDLKNKLPFIDQSKLVAINLDSMLITSETPRIGRSNLWAVDAINSTWWTKLSPTLKYPGESLQGSGRKAVDSIALSNIATSLAAAIAPQERKTGTWWSYRYIQAMNTVTPIATLWQESISLGDEWGMLPYQLEDMEPYDRQHIAFQQKKLYEAAIPKRSETLQVLEKVMLNLSKERN